MESLRMQGKSVIVTGGAKGIGEGCVRACHRLGADVLVFDMDEVAMHALANELNSKGLGRVVVQKGDVRSESDVRLCMTLAVGNFLGIDALICNAGWHPPAVSIEDASVDDFESIMRLNLTSTFLFCKYATPLLKKSKGAIVIVSSHTAVYGQSNAVPYCASKAGQLGLMKGLAVDLAPFQVRVNAVCPSNVLTPLMTSWAQSLPDPAKALAELSAQQLIGRMATINEIGSICAFLASPDAAFITGQEIVADGGANLNK
eukprot:Opistho-2@80905